MSTDIERLNTSLQRLPCIGQNLTFRHVYDNHIILLTEIVCALCANLEQAQLEIDRLRIEMDQR